MASWGERERRCERETEMRGGWRDVEVVPGFADFVLAGGERVGRVRVCARIGGVAGRDWGAYLESKRTGLS